MARTKASGRSNHSHRFSEVPSARIPRASFDRSFTVKTAFSGGNLVPLDVQEILPGDTVKMRMTIFARLATPIHPVMDNLFLDSFFFFVPNRLVWDNWVKFMGEQASPGDTIDYTVPTNSAPSGGYKEFRVADYMGIPTKIDNIKVNALPFRGWRLIWNEWFRDQNLQTPLTISTGDGPDASEDAPLPRRGKRHDYFTSCLPWPQKGDAVQIPLGGDAIVYQTADVNQGTIGNFDKSALLTGRLSLLESAPGSYEGATVKADLSAATAATVNQLRQAFQIQKLLERDARSGTRYPEILQAHFGVTDPSMAVLQRPQYLGGSVAAVNITPIAQTSETGTGSQTPQGNLAAMGTVTHQAGFTQSFTEHGYLFAMCSARADLTYQQGLHRMWSRETRYDYYWPVLAMLGEQAVLNKEIYAQGTAVDDQVFGYQERHAEYRYGVSRVTSRFRSNSTQTLDPWHLAQNFTSLPVLNGSFIEDNPPIDRVVAVADEPDFIADCRFQLRHVRPMPVYGIPGMIDHL